jgi:hypothetical protein
MGRGVVAVLVLVALVALNGRPWGSGAVLAQGGCFGGAPPFSAGDGPSR